MARPLAPDQKRRLAARRNDGRVKLVVTSLNAIALAIFAMAFVVPAINNVAVLLSPGPRVLLIVAVAVNLATGHVLLRFSARRFDRTYGHTDRRPPGE